VDTSKIGTITTECSAHAVGFSQFKPHRTLNLSELTTRTMLAPIDYLTVLHSYMDPANGTVGYQVAETCARLINLEDQFSTEYGSFKPNTKIDLGEFNVWVFETL
jgi:hypothetical protein